ncbi:hypothetical protein J6590_025996 [Homalodisca vitripennis]|nr:hypothetical protein J6590_025996 [Homalodisca vitripennis]
MNNSWKQNNLNCPDSSTSHLTRISADHMLDTFLSQMLRRKDRFGAVEAYRNMIHNDNTTTEYYTKDYIPQRRSSSRVANHRVTECVAVGAKYSGWRGAGSGAVHRFPQFFGI